MTRGIFIVMMLMICFSCTDQKAGQVQEVVINPMERLNNDKAGEVVRKAIEFAGGWEAWNSKSNFSFYKNITQLDSTATIVKKVKQHHQYNMKPGFQARMSWSIGEDDYIIVNTGNEARKYKDGNIQEDDKSKKEAWNSSFGSNYVISMPFKLTDPGVVLTYDGIDSTVLEKPVYAVKVEYKEGAGSSGGYHTWWYYFDMETYDLAANFLDSGKGYSLTTYETFTEVDGIRLHLKRLSYTSNVEKEKVELRTIYENEDMKFDQEIRKSVFQFL